MTTRRVPGGFPWHPHRGIETITYVLAGTVEHGDSLGNRGMLGCRRPAVDDGRQRHHAPGDAEGRRRRAHARLPALGEPALSLKMTAPRYQDVKSATIPEIVDDDGTRVRVVCGDFWGKSGPVDGIAADPRYLDIFVPPGKRKRHSRSIPIARVCLRLRRLGPSAMRPSPGVKDREGI
jgi:quercetin 2,3-dioxygenase